MDTDTRKLPLVYIVNNTKSSEHGVNTAPAELLTEALVKRYKDRVSVDFEDDDDGDAQLTGTDHDNKDRARFNRLIRSFIKTNSLLSKDEDEKLKEHANAVNEHREKMKKEESDVFLTKFEFILLFAVVLPCFNLFIIVLRIKFTCRTWRPVLICSFDPILLIRSSFLARNWPLYVNG